MRGRKARRAGLPILSLTALLAVGACSPPESSNRSTRSESLIVEPVAEGVYCDETVRPAATIGGAQPGETIELTSPMPIDVTELVADETGNATLTWSCEKAESLLTWDVTATGSESGLVSRFSLSGSDRDPELERVLIYEPVTDIVICDRDSNVVGRLSNAEPHEAIEFTSPDSTAVSPALADAQGSVEVRWSCSADQDGSSWRLTATGLSSNRSAEFTLTGLAPQPAEAGPIVVEMVENPFVCDRGRRPVARLANLVPDAAVAFDASSTDEQLRTGQARSDGTLAVYWQCDRRDHGTTWEMTATEVTPAARSITFSFTATTLESDVALDITENPFVCDTTTRPFAVLRNFVPQELIDFESPQSPAIRSGQADPEGNLTLRWSCTPEQAGTVWEVTATGRTSGAAVTFTITGASP